MCFDVLTYGLSSGSSFNVCVLCRQIITDKIRAAKGSAMSLCKAMWLNLGTIEGTYYEKNRENKKKINSYKSKRVFNLAK